MATNYETDLKDFPSLFSLKGKVVVVTGGSRGLGLHAASGCVSRSTQEHKFLSDYKMDMILQT